MFLESFSGTGRKELESQFQQLDDQLKNKEAELETKERQIQHLSKSIRKWTRKYHELEVSISETVIDEAESADIKHDEETKQLRSMLLKLNHKNRKLEKRIEKLQSISNELELNSPSSPDTKSTDTENTDTVGKGAVEEPEFSVEIQNQFQEYASKCG